MATSKEYAYYIKGNKVAIVQKDWTSSGGQTLSQPGLNDLGAQGALLWNSPKESITDGLELQYVYSPQYSIPDIKYSSHVSKDGINQYYLNGWTVIDGYLTFLRSHGGTGEGDVVDWTNGRYTSITQGSEGGSSDYIVIFGSNRWNGLHKIQTAGSDGTLKTYTKVNEPVTIVAGTNNIDILAEEDADSDGVNDRALIRTNTNSDFWLNHLFSVGDYIFIADSAQTKDNGMWKISEVAADAATEVLSGIYIKNRYFCYTSESNLQSTEGISEVPDTGGSENASITIYRAYRDFCYLVTDVNVLDDESDELDIPRYLANAIVYYVKAKYAEDAGELEMKEYFMREFRRITEKHQSAKKMGTYRIQGLSLFR